MDDDFDDAGRAGLVEHAGDGGTRGADAAGDLVLRQAVFVVHAGDLGQEFGVVGHNMASCRNGTFIRESMRMDANGLAQIRAIRG